MKRLSTPGRKPAHEVACELHEGSCETGEAAEPQDDDDGRGTGAVSYELAPNAVAASKKLARSLGPKITLNIIDTTIQALADTWEGEEAEHGISAFLGKTKPRWMP